MAKKIKTYTLLSPDGFPLDIDNKAYTEKEINPAIDKFKKRFESQGYYSANWGRIPLDEIEKHITIELN